MGGSWGSVCWVSVDEGVSPGKKSAGLIEVGIEEQGIEHLELEPDACRLQRGVAELVCFEEGLEALECELDLPPGAIELENHVGGQIFGRNRGEHAAEARRFQS